MTGYDRLAPDDDPAADDIVEISADDFIGRTPITMTAEVNGHRLTLDPVMPLVPLDAKPRRVENSMPAGFRVMWLDGDSDGYDIELLAGAGVGSPYLILVVRKNGEPFAEEIIDARTLVTDWLASVIEQGPTP